jgi:hypothetical protein
VFGDNNWLTEMDGMTIGEVIQLQGDFRKEAATFLATYNICEKETIKVHGA